MLFSEFTPLGLFELSGEEPIAERIYVSMVAAHGGQFDMTPGESRQEAWCFAAALSKACAAKALERAGNQAHVAQVDTLLADREYEFRIVPSYDATFLGRRAELVRRQRRPATWTKVRIEEALRDLLGDDFIAYRTTTTTEASPYPAALGDQPQNLQLPSVARKLLRITEPISVGLGAPQTVTYELVDTPQAPTAGVVDLVVGDSVVVEPEILGITETVQVTAVTGGTFTATFDLPHTNGCLGSTAPYPKWTSTKRHSLVVVTPAASVDPEKRRIVNAAMRRMVRASSTWDVVQSADGIVTGTFVVASSVIGAQTIASLTI